MWRWLRWWWWWLEGWRVSKHFEVVKRIQVQFKELLLVVIILVGFLRWGNFGIIGRILLSKRTSFDQNVERDHTVIAFNLKRVREFSTCRQGRATAEIIESFRFKKLYEEVKADG